MANSVVWGSLVLAAWLSVRGCGLLVVAVLRGFVSHAPRYHTTRCTARVPSVFQPRLRPLFDTESQRGLPTEVDVEGGQRAQRAMVMESVPKKGLEPNVVVEEC